MKEDITPKAFLFSYSSSEHGPQNLPVQTFSLVQTWEQGMVVFQNLYQGLESEVVGPFKVLDKERDGLNLKPSKVLYIFLIPTIYNGQTRHTQMHLPLLFLSQSSSTKRQTYPPIFSSKKCSYMDSTVFWSSYSESESPQLTDSHSR